MKRYFILCALIQSFLITNSFADESSNDFCSKLPGHWKGEYTAKDQKDCKLNVKCTQQFELDAIYVSGNEYRIALNLTGGQAKIFNIKCEKGVIVSSLNLNSQINASCDALNRCLVSYNDDHVTSEIMKS